MTPSSPPPFTLIEELGGAAYGGPLWRQLSTYAGARRVVHDGGTKKGAEEVFGVSRMPRCGLGRHVMEVIDAVDDDREAWCMARMRREVRSCRQAKPALQKSSPSPTPVPSPMMMYYI
jgi:hypothetical protein